MLSLAWVVLILSLLLTHLVRQTELHRQDERLAEADLRCRLALLSTFNQMRAGLAEGVGAEAGAEGEKADSFSSPWAWTTIQKRFHGEQTDDFKGIQIHVTIEDEDGKINLTDPSNQGRLLTLLQGLGWGQLQAEQIARAMLDRVAASTGAAEGEKAPAPPDLRFLLEMPEMSSILLYGEDANYNGSLDDAENDGKRTPPDDDQDGLLHPALVSFFTLHGSGKINPNLAPREILLTVPGVSKEIADEILSKRRGSDQLEGTADDFVFQKNEDLLNLRSVSGYRQFEYKKMVGSLAYRTDTYAVKLDAVEEKTGLERRVSAIVQRDEEGSANILSWVEDNGI